MKRSVLAQFEHWIQRSDRKPLVLRGARQVGKTFAVESFAKNWVQKNGGRFLKIDLREEPKLHSLFTENNSPKKIIELIEVEKGIKLNPQKDILFFDEIQECGEALTSLKYFEQHMKELALVVAGSHLGLINTQAHFPVGKVNYQSMFPMTFREFIRAVDEPLITYIDEFDIKKCKALPTIIHEKFKKYLSHYFAVGGLPEAVEKYRTGCEENLLESLIAAREVQSELLIGYMADFSRYAGTVNSNHIQSVFESIPTQLAQNHDDEVKKYKFSQVIPNQKGFARISGPLNWLCKSRLCIKAMIANQAEQPLLASTKDNVFKVFFIDVGLLNAALKTPIESIVDEDLGSYKGYVAENFVAQELYAHLDQELIAWQEGQAEIEFLVSQGKDIIPVEVKSSAKWRRAKSLYSFIDRYSPNAAYKVTNQNAGVGEHGFATLPMYLVSRILA